MTLKEIKYLLVVARCASISEAAKQLYVAQPSLTHAIQSVEKEVGFQIFQRGRSGVTVTERGEEFLGDIRTVYEQMAMVQGKYVEKRPERKVFSISMQHYSMAGAAFARFLRDLEEPYITTPRSWKAAWLTSLPMWRRDAARSALSTSPTTRSLP